MNDFIKIRKDLDEQAQKKIKTLLKKYKSGQDDLIEEIAAIILKNQDDSGFVVYSPSMVAEIKKDIKNNLDSLSKSENDFLEKLLEDAASDAIKETALKIGMVADWHILRDEFVKRAINTPIDGKNFSSRIWENTNDLANRIYNDVLDCIRNGTRPNTIARKIKDDYGATAYRVSKFLGTDEGKKFLQPQLDSYFSKGLETWKTNNLEGLVNAKVKELYPDADPKDTELAAVKAELERIKAESVRKDLANKALTYANESN